MKNIMKSSKQQADNCGPKSIPRHKQFSHPLPPPCNITTRSKTFFLLAVITLLSSCTSAQHNTQFPALQTVDHVDINRYLGKWYEIGRYPNSFQEGCTNSTATYSSPASGKIKVVNSCQNEKDGSWKTSTGRAWIVDSISNARLKVSFFWPFRGDYWIIDLGQDYEYAVVGTPSRKYLWILSRTKEMSPDALEKVLQNVDKQGFVRDNLLFNTERPLL